MTQLLYLSEVERNSASVITVGTFDGVHEGHKSLIKTVVDKARKSGSRSVVVSFDPHPRDIINPGSKGIKLLTTLEERRRMLSRLGVDLLVIIPFDRDFSLMSSEEFVRLVIFEKIGVSEFVIGYDHHFGRNREGTIATVRKMGRELGFRVHIVQAHEVKHVTVSSTFVRKALEEKGDVGLARQYLGQPYALSGTVVHGDKRGKSIGFPTANIKVDNSRKIVPHDGVYAVDVKVNGKKFRGMMNIGVRPTFKSNNKQEKTIEVNIFEFNEDIYGKTIEVYFLDRVREEIRFKSREELIRQLEKDKISCSKAE